MTESVLKLSNYPIEKNADNENDDDTHPARIIVRDGILSKTASRKRLLVHSGSETAAVGPGKKYGLGPPSSHQKEVGVAEGGCDRRGRCFGPKECILSPQNSF